MARKHKPHEALAGRVSRYLSGWTAWGYANPARNEVHVYNACRGVFVAINEAGNVRIEPRVIASYGTTSEQFRAMAHVAKICRKAGFTVEAAHT